MRTGLGCKVSKKAEGSSRDWLCSPMHATRALSLAEGRWMLTCRGPRGERGGAKRHSGQRAPLELPRLSRSPLARPASNLPN